MSSTDTATSRPADVSALVKHASKSRLALALHLADRVGSRPENTSISHPYAATALTYALGAASHAADVSWLETGGIGVGGTILAAVLAARHADDTKHGPGYRALLVAHSVVSGLGATGIAEYLRAVGPFDLPGLLALGAGALLSGGAYAVLRFKERRTIKAYAQAEAKQSLAEDQLQFIADWHAVFARAGLRRTEETTLRDGTKRRVTVGLKVLQWGGSSNGASLWLDLVDTGAGLSAQTINAEADRLAGMISWQFRTRRWQVGPDSVSVTQERGAAHRFRMWVRVRDVLGGSRIRYVVEEEPSTFADPFPVGTYENGDPALMSMRATNTLVVGAMGSGKTVLLNNLIGRGLDCDDVVVWVGATEKLGDLAWPWLRPWVAGDVDAPAIDWVAGQSVSQVHAMLAAALRIAHARNNASGGDPKKSSPGYPALLIILDEASSFLMDHPQSLTWTDIDGTEYEDSCSELLKKLAQVDRSANISAVVGTQYGIQDALGDDGAFMRRNFTGRVLMKVMADYDAESVLTVKSRTQRALELRDHTFYVQPNVEAPQVHRTKAAHLEGRAEVARVVTLTAGRRARLDAGSVKAAGTPYVARWRATLNPDMVRLASIDGLTWPEVAEDGSTRAWQPPAQREAPMTTNEMRQISAELERKRREAAMLGEIEQQAIGTLPPVWRKLYEGALEVQKQVPEGAKYFATTSWLAECVGVAESQDDKAGVQRFAQTLAQFGIQSERESKDGPRGHRLITLLRAAEQMAIGKKQYDPNDTDSYQREVTRRRDELLNRTASSA